MVDTRAYRLRGPARGEVVAVRPRGLGGKALVKRVAAVSGRLGPSGGVVPDPGRDEFLLMGDGASSLDSRAFGPVSREELIGRVCFRLWPRPSAV